MQPEPLAIDLIEQYGHGLDSQAIDFGALDAWLARPAIGIDWGAGDDMTAYITVGRDAEFEVTSGGIIPPASKPDAPKSEHPTAPSVPGLTTCATDGERLGRLAWMPGSN